MNNKITIIVTAYNSEKYIERCIISLINQTYKNIDIIVVNDGSSDGTLNILKKYQKTSKNIKIYTKKNGGISEAREYGIKKCATTYLMFVDSDDFLENNAVEMLYNKLKATQSDIVMGNIIEKNISEIYIEDDKYDYLFNYKIDYFMVLWNKLFKRKIFNDLKFPRLVLAEDEYLIHHILKNTKKMIVIPDKTYNYSINEEGLSSKYLDNYKDIIFAFKDRCDFFKDTKYRKKAYKQYMNYHINLYCQLRKKNLIKKEIVQEFKENMGKTLNLKYLLFYFCDELYYKLFKIRSKLCKKYQ